MSETIARREFLGRSAAGGIALGLASKIGSIASANAASRTIVVGVMGLSRGRALAEGFSRQADCVVKYACDVDEQRARACAAAVEKAGGKAEPITDFRRILDDKEVDALVCAAPNHWHGPATILACSARKHVYVEKPCSHNPREGELMVEAARKHQRVVQMGSQRRSGPIYYQAIGMLREGVIGRVYCARSWYANTRPSIGTGKRADVPSHLDYELWQGPAPRMPYTDNRIPYNWHWFWHWGNGELGNNGVHALDICRWGLAVDYPTRVTSSGGRYRFQDDQETPDTHTVAFEFDDRKSISWVGMSCNRHRASFVTFYGENGTLALDGGGELVVYNLQDKEVQRQKGSRGDDEHLANFLAAIRNEAPMSLNAEIEEGHKSTLLCHLGNIAHRTGRTLCCDPVNGHILDDQHALTFWSREYAKGWEPVV